MLVFFQTTGFIQLRSRDIYKTSMWIETVCNSKQYGQEYEKLIQMKSNNIWKWNKQFTIRNKRRCRFHEVGLKM